MWNVFSYESEGIFLLSTLFFLSCVFSFPLTSFFEAPLLFFGIFSGLHNHTFSTTKLTYSTVKLKQETVVQGQVYFHKA